MKLLVDEMWSARAAVELRRTDHDVIAVVERSDLRGQTDSAIFAFAQVAARAIVTENVVDFRALVTGEVQAGRAHAGVVFTSNHRYPRHDSRTLGRLVNALDALLGDPPGGSSWEHWLK